MATDHPLKVIDRDSPSYPILLARRMGKDAPFDFGQSADWI